MNNAPLAPVWLVEQLTSPANTNAAPKGFMNEGSRNTNLTSLAGFLRKTRGLDAERLFLSINAVNGTALNPLPESEVRAIACSVANYPAGNAVSLQDVPLSRYVAESIAAQCRHVPEFGWMNWDGTRWAADIAGLQTCELVKGRLEVLFEGIKASCDMEYVNKARPLLSAGKVNAIMGLIASDAILRAGAVEFDAVDRVLNVTNGTLDLGTISLRRHEAKDLLTKVAKAEFDPAAVCPRFDSLLARSLPEQHRAFVLRLLGYAMLGKPVEQVFAMFVGTGANGKSTLMNAVANALGDYSANVEPSSFIRQKNDRIRNDLARLKGARLVGTSELATGEILDAALVKRFTGGDNITARALYKELIEFKAEFVVVMTTNALPVIDGGDAALSRRIIIVPFRNVIPADEMDPQLPRVLEEEASGILNRLLDGLAEYYRIGIAMPFDLAAEAAQYCVSSDMLSAFMQEECESEPGATVGSQELYLRYRLWCGSSGLRAMSQPQFRQVVINKLQHPPSRTKAGTVWSGLRLRKSTI
jgi:putative DNA primase/helicase